MWEAISKLGTTPLTLLFAAGLIICIIVMMRLMDEDVISPIPLRERKIRPSR